MIKIVCTAVAADHSKFATLVRLRPRLDDDNRVLAALYGDNTKGKPKAWGFWFQLLEKISTMYSNRSSIDNAYYPLQSSAVVMGQPPVSAAGRYHKVV